MRSRRRRVAPALALGAAATASWPGAAAAQAAACEHPFSGGVCLQVFALVCLVYALLAGTYALGALMILKPRVPASRWKWAMLGAIPAAWLPAMIAFTVGGAAGILAYPHDASPFFFMDWFAALVTLAAMTGYVAALARAPEPAS